VTAAVVLFWQLNEPLLVGLWRQQKRVLITAAAMAAWHLLGRLPVGCGDGYSKRYEIDSCGSHCQNGTYQLGVAMATASERAAATGVAATVRMALTSWVWQWRQLERGQRRRQLRA
jgi:hypothetical protein